MQEALAAAGLTIGPCRLGSYGGGFGRVAGRDVLSQHPRPTAIVCGSHDIAIGVIEAGRQMKLLVPGDLSLTGFDDMRYAALISPALTTVRQPVSRIGQLAFDTLLARLDGAAVPPPVRLPVALCIRQSTCSPKGYIR